MYHETLKQPRVAKVLGRRIIQQLFMLSNNTGYPMYKLYPNKYLLLLSLYLISFSKVDAQNACIDSTFKKSFSIPNESLLELDRIKTNDSGSLNYFSNKDFSGNITKRGLIKFSKEGNIEWDFTLNFGGNPTESYYGPFIQLSNGEYILSGSLLTNTHKIFIIKLSAQGQIIWQNLYVNQYISSPENIINICDLGEGRNGEILIFSRDANIYGNRGNITLLNTQGNIIWSNTYFGNINFATNCVKYNSVDSAINIWGESWGPNAQHCLNSYSFKPTQLSYFELDYSNGELQNNKNFCKASNTQEVYMFSITSSQAKNLVYYPLNNGYSLLIKQDHVTSRYLHLILFDKQKNFLKSFYLNLEHLELQNIMPIFHFDVNLITGEIVFTIVRFHSPTATLLPHGFVTQLDKYLQIQKQFFLQNNLLEHTYRAPKFLQNGSLNLITNQRYDNSSNLFQIIYSNTLPGATAEAYCNAKDSTFGIFEKLDLVNNSNSVHFDSIYQNVYVKSGNTSITLDTINISRSTTCKIISICDSIKIIGPTSICLNKNDSITYSFYKNQQCLKEIAWSIDTSYATITGRLGENTMGLKFKKEGQVSLYLGLNGCSLKDSIIINIKAPKTGIHISYDSLLCPGSSVTLYATKGFNSYQWQNISGADSLVITQPGLYKVTGIDYCGNSFSDSIEIDFVNTSIAIPDDVSICLTDSFKIKTASNISSISWQPNTNVEWQNGWLMFFPDRNTNYALSMLFNNKCYTETTINISVTLCPETIYFPNSFTPNNDGLNDRFKPAVSKPLAYFQFIVFNRYGQKLFETNNPQSGWNGYFKNKPQPTGSYVWQCSYRFANSPTKRLKGNVLIIR